MKMNGEYLTQSKLPINLNEFIHFSCIHKVPNYLNTAWSVNDEQLETKGGFFSKSSIHFLDLQISKKKIIPKNYPELEI